MKRYLCGFLFSAIILTGASGVLRAEVATGGEAPDFSLADASGTRHQLSGYRGKYVILEWINPECPFVRKHYDSGNMQMLQEEMTARGAVWLSIASSTPGKQGYYEAVEWLSLIESEGSAADAVLLDPEGDAGRLYGAKTTPHMFIINPEGILIYQGAIDDTPSADPSDIPDSVNFVRQAMDEALQGQPVSRDTTQAYGCSVKY